MKPEKNVLIVPLVAIKSTVVKRLLLIVVAEMLLADMVSAIILDVLIFTGLKVVTVRLTMEAFVGSGECEIITRRASCYVGLETHLL